MKKRLYYLICGLLTVITMLLVFSPFQPVVAQKSSLEINIVAGNEVGEYYSVAKDIEKLGREKGVDIDVIPSRGSLQNIHDVFYYESIPLGIIQGDILAFLNIFANNDEEARMKAEALRIVLPLHKENVHVIARQDIKSVQELAGKKVSIGDEGSGTSVTAAVLLNQWGIEPQELFTYNVKKAIDALRKGKIDAMFYVVGDPAKVLQEQIIPEDNFHFLPVSLTINAEDDFYNRLYSKATLPANTYSWQKEPVETLAVQSFLMTVEEDSCEKVTPVANLIKDNLSWFQKNGDAVWKGIDLKLTPDKEAQKVSKCVKS